MNYISREAAKRLLLELRQCLKKDSLVFLRTRHIKDYRFGRGQKVEHNGFVLDIKETGEYGTLNVFYYEYELVDMLREGLGLDIASMQLFSVDALNLHSGVPMLNSDLVIWGKSKLVGE